MHDRTSILFDYIFAQKAKSRNWQLQGFKIHPGQKLNILGVAKEATSAMRCFASTLHMADEEIRNMSKDCVMRVVEATCNFFSMSPWRGEKQTRFPKILLLPCLVDTNVSRHVRV